jgi:hypothetical protein
MQRRRKPIIPLALLIACALSACEQLGLEDGKIAEAEGKAVGAACRHAGRALEDCYQINPKAPKSAIFTGWKEMNDYMTEQKLEVIKPTLPPPLPKAKKKADTEADADEPSTEETPKSEASGPGNEAKPAEDAAKHSEDKNAAKPEGKTAKRKAAAEV